MFSPILDAFVMFSSPNRRRKRVVQEEEENFSKPQQKTKTREKSPLTVGAHPSANATPETPTVISGVISEYKAAPETNCIKAINAKKAVNNFVAVNCMLLLIIYCLFTRVLVRSAMLRSVGEKNESHERERFFEKSDQET